MATPTVFPILPLNTEGQELTPVDVSSVSTITLQNTFDVNTDVIQAYLYDINNNVISRLTTNYSVTSGNVSGSTITELNLDPAADLQKNNYTQGTYNINYNFLSALVQGNPLFRIQEISSTRTELRVYNSSFTSTETQQVVDSITAFLSSTPTFQGYYLDFGLDTIILGVNITADNNSILIKLYEPLPDTYGINTVFNLVEKKAEPVAYNVSFPQEEVIFDSTKYLRGPNFNLRNSQQSNASTDYETYGSLFSGTTTLTNQLKSVLAERRAELNTDYTSLPNFVFFSSAEQRLINFYEKASLIEEYTNQIDILNTLTLTNEVSASKAYYQQKIDDLIVNFDGYDYFLYFDSGSKSWPKSNSTKPYTLYSTGSSQVLTWYPEQINSGSLYDSNNQNYVYNIYPVYITEDTDNEQFRLFNEMVAQMFDQVWMYTKAIENRQSGDNRLSEGISIDLAADALRSYGVSLYESSFANVDLYTTYLGITPEGSTLPPTGSEWITNYVTASADTTPFNDAQKLIYKRLYHNLPYLLKKKGTVSGLRVLLNCFGIPDTILKINEFGGKDKNTNTWDNWQYQFNYAYRATGSNYISSSFVLNSAWAASNNRPSSVAFRFKPETNYPTLATQSLWTLNSGQVKVTLEYAGSGTVSGSYSGSITNPYNNYGTLKFVVNSTTSASLYLPFFNGDWWSVLVTSGSSDGYTLYAKSNTFGNTVNNTIGFQASSSINIVTNWSGSTTSSFGNVFSGSFQELRYYKAVLNELAFNDYVMNPSSIEGNSTNSSPEELVFRATLGSELYTGSISVHPKNTGTWTTTSSFNGTSNFYYSNPPTFNTNYEYVYFDQPPVGIQNPVNSKIQNQTIVLPPTASTQYSSNKVLSANISVQQNTIQNQDYTADVNYVEIALSPTNEINDDINSSLGYFNLGEYIGDPRQISSSGYSYPALDSLSQNYFQKYSESYNWNDFIRIVKYFDNAVFRMLKDFIPARAGVATGVVIKQHLLERNRQRPAQVSYSQLEYTGSVTSLARDYQTGSIEVFTGGAGGSVNVLTNISQSWTSSILTKAGLVTGIESSQYEFFNGEYSGSTIDAVRNKLQDNPLLGADFRVGIPDLQNLSVNISGAFFESGSNSEFKTGTLPFKITNSPSTIYNTTTYTYTPDYNTISDVNIALEGAWSNQTGNARFYIYFVENGNNILASTQFENTGTGTIEPFSETLTVYNVSLNNNSSYSVLYVFQSLGVNQRTISLSNLTTWTVSVDNLFAQSTYYLDPTVYTQQNFPGDINDYSDYNSLLNNVYSNRVSNLYYDVDYNGDALNPTNFTTIISQSAIYAQVQDSNYATGSVWNKGRYEGTKLTSATYNTYTDGDTSYGKTAVIDNYCDYIAQFDWVGGADPEYPGGGNIHIIGLIHTDGTVIGLDGSNSNLNIVEQIFRQGDLATAYISSYSSNQSVSTVEIEIGGGLYQTILVNSGSNTAQFTLKWENDAIASTYTPVYFLTGSAQATTLIDNNQKWLYPFLTGSDSNLGKIEYLRPDSADQTFFFYNKNTGGYPTSNDTNRGATLYKDTLLPLQYGDYIRFGTTGSIQSDSGSLDGSFSGLSLAAIRTLTFTTASQTSSLDIVPTVISSSLLFGASTNTNQNYRIFRRIPNETFVLVKNKPVYAGGGLLIPANFNPNYNPLDVARKAGITL